MSKKFKDLKKGDHIYCVGVHHKTYEPYFCEYELVDDMVWTGPEYVVWTCHIIPINYDPKSDFWCPDWDGKPKEFHPGWMWNYDGKDCQTTTSVEYAKEYYIKYFGKHISDSLNEKIKKLEKKINDMRKLKAYHDEQTKNFDFNRKWKY